MIFKIEFVKDQICIYVKVINMGIEDGFMDIELFVVLCGKQMELEIDFDQEQLSYDFFVGVIMEGVFVYFVMLDSGFVIKFQGYDVGYNEVMVEFVY